MISRGKSVEMKFSFSLLCALLSITNGYKILFLVPLNGPSHWFLLQNFVKELVSRGHEVTAIVNKPIDNFQSPKYTEILIDPPLDLKLLLPSDSLYRNTKQDDFKNIEFYDLLATTSSKYGLNNANVQQVINSKDLHFDLVINEDIFHESWLMFGYKFNAPVVTICTYGYSDFFDRAMGLLTPLSHVPHAFLHYNDQMTYWERVYNVILSSYDYYYRNWIALPKQNQIAKQYFGHLTKNGKPLPTVEELYRNVSMTLVMVHRSISEPRPTMPGLIYVGGAHIKKPKPLPADLKKFLDDSKDGVIFFTLGMFMKSAEMPEEKLNAFLQSFSKLKQNIIWKFENESIPNLPPNVLIRKWLPQSDILAHENVVLFITHGGMSGTFEGTARGVPMLFTPIYGDQHRNAIKTVAAGYGLRLPFGEITTETLTDHLNEILNNKKYFDRAKEVASLFNDNLVHPMDEAMYWIEYVARHKGAAHLKSNAANMSWFSYLLLDIILVIPVTIVIILYAIFKLVSRTSKKRNEASEMKKFS